jgi:hypothetical protein
VAVDQHVIPLVACALLHSPGLECPEQLREYLLNAMRAESSTNLIRRQRIMHLLQEMKSAGIDAKVIKGYAVSGCYAHPECRGSVDTDLYIDVNREKIAIELLEAKAKPMAADEDDKDKEDEKKSEDEDDTEEKETEDKCGKDSDDDEKEDKKAEDALDKLMAVVKDMADDIKKLVADKSDDEEKETEDEDEKEKETEDEDDDESDKETEDSESDEEETKKSEDSAVFVFGADSAIKGDEALQDYLK